MNKLLQEHRAKFGEFEVIDWVDEGEIASLRDQIDVDVALASKAGQVYVVLGCQADDCQAALGDRPVRVVFNSDWAQGQSTSVRVGLGALPDNVDAILFHLVDLPGVTSAVMDALIQRRAATLAPVVWPEYKGQRGNPVLFDRIAFRPPRFYIHFKSFFRKIAVDVCPQITDHTDVKKPF